MTTQTKQITISSITRLHPSPPILTPHKIPLSILDNKTARFTPAAAIFTYPASSSSSSSITESLTTLTASLQSTVTIYPQWTGQLHWTIFNPTSHKHTDRFGRLCLTWGGNLKSDPGIELVIAHCAHSLAAMVPQAGASAAGPRPRDADGRSLVDYFLPRTSLPPQQDQGPDKGLLPSVGVQLTSFACGGVAMGVKIAHPLADAQSLMCFVGDWAAVNRAMLAGEEVPRLAKPVFDPGQVDATAAGNIDAGIPGMEIIDVARKLPASRYDQWNAKEGWPWGTDAPGVPDILDQKAVGPLGMPIPWKDWDVHAPVADHLLYFSGAELRRMWEEANHGSAGVKISRMDALLAHVWKLINRARGMRDDKEFVTLSTTLGLRSRVEPKLSKRFLGSPVFLASVRSTGQNVCTGTTSQVAARIHDTVMRFDSSSLPALLHDMAYEDGAQRIWNGFLGRRNLIATSWIHLGVPQLDFGIGRQWYAEALVPSLDGVVQFMEAGSKSTLAEQGEVKHWSDSGVMVSAHLEFEVMHRLLEDPLLEKYRLG